MMAKMNRFLRLNRCTKTPQSGVATASDIRYDVSTQAIWSWAAESEPCMWLSATATTVVSSTCITGPVQSAAVISAFLAPRY
jgi:hypothetical protein